MSYLSPEYYMGSGLRTRRGLNPLGAARCEAADVRVIAILCALFVVLNLPETYKLVNSLWVKIPGLSSSPITDASGKPTKTGVAVHTAVFGLILYIWVLCK
jgi:hypothetical protein